MNRRFTYDPETDSVVEVGAERRSQSPHWPIESESAAVHPSQIGEAREFNRNAGVPTTEYTKAGCPVFTSHAHRKAYLRAWKYHDKKGFN